MTKFSLEIEKGSNAMQCLGVSNQSL